MDDEIHVQLENGKKIKHKKENPECVVADAIPHIVEVEIGTRVLAKWYNRLDTYYPGTVIAIRRSFFDIRFDDGDKGCNEIRELRILSQIGTGEGKLSEKLPSGKTFISVKHNIVMTVQTASKLAVTDGNFYICFVDCDHVKKTD